MMLPKSDAKELAMPNDCPATTPSGERSVLAVLKDFAEGGRISRLEAVRAGLALVADGLRLDDKGRNVARLSTRLWLAGLLAQKWTDLAKALPNNCGVSPDEFGEHEETIGLVRELAQIAAKEVGEWLP